MEEVKGPVPEWIPVARELIDRGVKSSPELVYTFAFRTFELDCGTQLTEWERLPRAFSTVAEALVRSIAAVEQEVVAVASRVDEERSLRRRCADLSHLLRELPGVRSVSRPSYGPNPLTAFFRNYAISNGVPLPQLAQGDPGWRSLLARWSSPSALQLSVVMRAHSVSLESGEVLQPPAPEAAEQTIAEVLGVPLHQALRARDNEAMTALQSGSLEHLMDEAIAHVRTLPGVATISTATPRNRAALPPPEYDGPPLAPPWTVFPEPPTSMRWRMGPGEDFLTEWWSFWRALAPAEQRTYFDNFVPPAEWLHWSSRALHDEEHPAREHLIRPRHERS